MNIHEYQAKELLGRYGVKVPRGKIAFTPREAEEIAKEFLADGKNSACVVKAQIHAGGRGKAGGVKFAKTGEEARANAEALLGKVLVTHQTGPRGKEVKKVLVEEGCQIAKEYYLGVVVDRAHQRVCMIASSEGGVEIEEVALKNPGKILKEYVDPAVGLQAFSARNLSFGLSLDKALVNKAVKFMMGLYNHKDIEGMRDLDEEDPREVEASRYNLNYVSLDGNIGCMVNGAGLAMATMDIIKLYGGSPANFLDVGGGATKEQ